MKGMRKMQDNDYLSGFGNEFASEAVKGALPQGQNSPQHVPFGLYSEQISGTAFTVPRNEIRRSWLYRVRPSAAHKAYQRRTHQTLQSGPFSEATPNRLRWDPLPMPKTPIDFIDSLITYGGNGAPDYGVGLSIHLYVANHDMKDKAFYDADGELLIVPQEGGLNITTEFGRMEIVPGEIAIIPRGIKFRIDLPAGSARGYVCENHGSPFRLPELGAIGSNGLANPRDFLSPCAAFEQFDRQTQLTQKYLGALWVTELDHSPFDVVAWHGNYVPYKYDLANFMAIGSISFDHPDPSIFTVLTAPGDKVGVANVDFVAFAPRWLVAEHTFRPPWFHRNAMNEFMGLIRGEYDAKSGGFVPGGASLHNAMSAHGPDAVSHQKAVSAELIPQKLDNTLAFMFETRFPIRLTQAALELRNLQSDYDSCWQDFPANFKAP